MLKTKLLILGSALLALTANADYTSAKATWESRMISYGQTNCQRLQSNTINGSNQNDTYYDGEAVFYAIGTYTGNPQWNQCASRSEYHYRDGYLAPNGFSVPGYWVFARGLLTDYLRTGDGSSLSAINGLLAHGSYCTGSAYELAHIGEPGLQREVSYCLMLMIEAGKVGIPTPNRAVYLEALKSHLRKQFIPNAQGVIIEPYHQPFMVGLATEALMQYWEEVSHDHEIPTLLKAAADTMWSTDWDPVSKSFWYYANPDPRVPSRDLNLLILPIWGWLYKEGFGQSYKINGDVIFESGATGAIFTTGKQFNQNYRSSFNYVKWREGATASPTPTSSPTPTATPVSTPTPTVFPPTPTATPMPTPTPTQTPTPMPTALPPKCKKPNGLTVRYLNCRITRIVKINNLVE